MGLLDFSRRRDKPEDRSVVVYNGNDLTGAWLWNSAVSDAGVTVTRDSALGLDTVWAGVNRVATDIAKMPLKVYKRGEGSTKQQAEKHPSYFLLHDEPNIETVAFTFKQTLVAHSLLTGNGYAWIERKPTGDPHALWVLDPDSTWPTRINGQLFYKVQGANGQPMLLDADDVLHFKNLSPDGLVGYSVIDLLVNALGGALATRKFANVYFENNARPSVVIEFPEGRGLKDKEAIERFRESWSKIHAGVDNAHRPAILEDGAKLSSVTITAEDAQLIEKSKFDVRVVANILDIPPHKIGDDSRTSHNSLESENRDYLSRIDGRLVMLEQECSKKLTRTKERRTRTHFVEFVREAFLQADKKTEQEVLTERVNNGFLTLNEARDIQNKPRYDIDEADKPRMPVNHMPVDAPPEPAPEPPQDPDPPEQEENSHLEASLRQIFRDTATRMISRLSVHAERAAKKPEQYNDTIDAIADKHGTVVRDALSSPLEAIHAYNGSTNTVTVHRDFVVDFCTEALNAADCQPDDLVENVCTRLASFTGAIVPKYETLLFGSS